ncbi:uncharacterized protein LY89DRAFT_592608 [Mollisia scopiformis]|uniref:Sucrose transporter n=1 Tax=Mollisia scopiformis TaxID=149040 RepID=A0A194WXX9_MOLSC|nr:uncharacterized protein LY89DRAFT_592608 [Mollisia scopiformis]KUJ12457.1 hypothetical protein LY89DRAFT_592608 [Mollisia scopiformis]
MDSLEDQLDGSEDEKGPLSPTDSEDPILSKNNCDTVSLGWPSLFALTCGIGGLQVIWSVILSQGAPFLVSLGLPKSLTALVWIAGPFCGAFVQPIVGYLSDMSRYSWGQRRPFIVIGAVSTIFSLWMLAWTESGIKWVVQTCHLEVRKEITANVVIAFAVFWIYALNVSIQPLQVGLRALVVENCPTHQQAQASAWASLITGGGNIFGYLVGFTPLPEIAKQLYLTHFQWLGIIASLAVAITVSITCSFVHERSSEALLLPSVRGPQQFLRTFRTMPLKIRRVFHIQIFAWMAWFPYLFYATSYVGDLYFNAIPLSTSETYQPSTSAIRSVSTRVGTFATFLSAIVAFLTNMLLQFVIRQTTCNDSHDSKSHGRKHLFRSFTIAQVWTFAHIAFAILMFSTFLVKTHIGGTVLIAMSGISWAMTLWVPYAIIGQELTAKQDRLREIGTAELESPDENPAGLIMSLHNMAISLPQIAAALVCSVILWLSDGQNGLAWCLRAGGLAALGAAWTLLSLEDS